MAVNGHILINTLLVVFDLGGTFVFALSGATAAVKHRLDLFGVLVLSFAAGNSGGIARDVMIGAVPPAAISDWRYIAVSILAGVITFFWYRIINRLSAPCWCSRRRTVALCGFWRRQSAGFSRRAGRGDAARLLTGIGGGIVRDVLVREIPTVLRTELSAVAALIGAAVVVIGLMMHFPSAAAAVAGKSFALDSDLWPCGEAGTPDRASAETIGNESVRRTITEEVLT